MKKIKLSVGVLAFMGLAALNFTQSESCLVSKSLAANTCCNDTITTSDDSSSSSTDTTTNTSTSTSTNTSTDTSTNDLSSGNSSSSSGEKNEWGCEQKKCKYKKKVTVVIKVKGDGGVAGGEVSRTEEREVEFEGTKEGCVRVASGAKNCKKAKCNTECQ